MTQDPLYKDEAIIRSVTYSTNGGHKVTFEMDPEGWERFKGMETTRCMMVLVPIDNEGQPAEAPQPPPEKPKRVPLRMDELSRSQQAGILCNDVRFSEFLEKHYHIPIKPFSSRIDAAAAFIREFCRITSRSHLDDTAYSRDRWDALHNEYLAHIGRIAGPE